VPVIDKDNWGVTYVEMQDVVIHNKYRFLRFVEDVRPPYYGTWSKKSSKISGRRPFGKDVVMDYEYDSEAEWEEGDDEVGEDVGE
jgi:chromatin assembly factor 1 subunit A